MDERQKRVRRTIYRIAHEKKVSHIGPSLSCVDIISEIYDKYYDEWPNFEFILSKGHAVMALYSVLYDIGVLDEEDLEKIFVYGSPFTGHVPHCPNKLMRVPTGSLGHGLPIAAGMALASPQKTIICLLGDGETNEGTTWEAAAFANKYCGNNLKIIVDCNGSQGYDKTSDLFDKNIIDLGNKFRAFGLETIECYDAKDMVVQIENRDASKPFVFLVETEKKLEDHYKKINKEEYDKIMEALK